MPTHIEWLQTTDNDVKVQVGERDDPLCATVLGRSTMGLARLHQVHRGIPSLATYVL